MNKSLSFITGSHYEGTFGEALHIMDGFGTYVFPDGTEYRGYLKEGRFHGYGVLKMGPPNRFVFKGQFEMGELAYIETMTFADGLLLKGHYDNIQNKLDTRNWRYCCESDRRYSSELHAGMEPVGPNSYLTRQRPTRPLGRGNYDAEEGIFKESTHFMTEIPPPFHHIRFVSCIGEVKWIKEHCRKGRASSLRSGVNPVPVEPDGKICCRIINTNIKAMADLGENRNSCGCNDYDKRKQQLPNICPKVLLDTKQPLRKVQSVLTADDGDNDSDLAKTPSTESCNTLSDNTLIADVEANILIEMRNLKIASDSGFDNENSLMMDVRKSSVFFS